MWHRHLTEAATGTAPSIDDVISRGKWRDWVDLRNYAREHPESLSVIERVCAPHVADPKEQRYIFWNEFVRRERERIHTLKTHKNYLPMIMFPCEMFIRIVDFSWLGLGCFRKLVLPSQE